MLKVFCLVSMLLVSAHSFAGEEASVLAKEEVKTSVNEEASVVNCCCRSRVRREESCRSTCRNRLFGGCVRRTVVREVVRPSCDCVRPGCVR